MKIGMTDNESLGIKSINPNKIDYMKGIIMKIDLTIGEQQIYVSCEISFSQEEKSFVLAQDMIINDVKDEKGASIPYHSETVDIGLPAPVTRYLIDTREVNKLTLSYSGNVSGYFCYWEESIIHFSFYNAWYPIVMNADTQYELYIHINKEWNVVNANTVKEGLWIYRPKETSAGFTDCNLLAVKQGKFNFLEDRTVIFCYENRYQTLMEEYIEWYDSLYNFYLLLYERNHMDKQTVVFVPERKGWNGDAYKRAELSVLAQNPYESYEIRHLLAHELGHSYGCGANLFNWENWLNETTAEWSALLFEEKYNKKAFERSIKNHRAKMNGRTPCLDSHKDDNEDFVHHDGTLIYYEIFKTFGRETIILLLRTFDELLEKNTENLLRMIIQKGQKKVADLLKSYMI